MTRNGPAEDLPERGLGLPDPKVPHPSRTYDAWFQGKDSLGTDRQHIEDVQEVFPQAPVAVRSQRLFLERAVKYLVGEAGIRQILDIGCGYPQDRFENVHEIAQGIAPETRVAYVDNNAVAVAHMDALAGDRDKVVTFSGDLREPEAILDDSVFQAALDLKQPIGMLLVGLIHFMPDETDPAGLVARLRDALAPGSYVVMNQVSSDFDDRMDDVARVWQKGAVPMVPRGRAQFEQILAGFEPVEPGIVAVHDWRPDGVTGDKGTAYAVVARKP